VGATCSEYQNIVLRDLPCKNIQFDEIWSFCYDKEKNVPEQLKGKFGYGMFGHGLHWTQIQNLFLAGILDQETRLTE